MAYLRRALPLAALTTVTAASTPSFRAAGVATLLAAALFALPACGDQKPEGKTPAEAGGHTGATGDTARGDAKRTVPRGTGFDFYVLSLSWSPTWCAGNDPDGRSAQCRRGENNGFIVHGLWPQYESGYPEFCPSRQPDRVPDALGRGLMDIIPSMGLIGHQWRKHGSCSGLSQKNYFAVTRAARETVAIPARLEDVHTARRISPADIEAALVAANPGLASDGVAVICEDGRLEEVRICLTADLTFRGCPEVDRAACRAKTITQPPAR